MKRALVITPYSPLPDQEGHRKRILSTIKILKDLGFQIDIYFACLDYYWRYKSDRRQRSALRGLADTVHFVLGEQPQPAPDGQDYGLDDWMSPGFLEMAEWLAARNDYDLVFCNYVFLSKLLTPFGSGVAKILDTHDRFGNRANVLRSNNSPVEFFHCTEGDEARGLGRADLVLSIKDQEAAYFREITTAKILNLPYCEVKKPIRPIIPTSSNGAVRFGFFASENSINRANFLAFLEVYRQHPRFLQGEYLEIHVYGGLSKHLVGVVCPGLILCGPLQNAGQFYAEVDCVLIPQRFSTGLKIKMSEAMAFEIPILAHRHAAEGLVDDANSVFLFNDFEELVEACFRVKSNPYYLKTIGAEVIVAQNALREKTNQAVVEIGAFLDTSRIPTTIIVDGELLSQSPLYRCALHSVCDGLSHNGRLTILVLGGEGEAAAESKMTGWAYAEIISVRTKAEAVEVLTSINSGTCFLATPLDVQQIAEVAAKRRLCALDALVALVADNRFIPTLPMPEGVVTVSSRFQKTRIAKPRSEHDISIMHLRWCPWDMMISDGQTHAVWRTRPLVTVACGIAKRSGKKVNSVCHCGNCADLSLRALEDQFLKFGHFPRMVIDESGGAAGFALFFELMFWNDVPVVDHLGSKIVTGRQGNPDARGISVLLTPRKSRSPSVMDWDETGFEDLQKIQAQQNWVGNTGQVEVQKDSGARDGATSAERDKIKELEREVRQLRQAHEILRKASAYFAQAELDRPF